MKRLGYTPVRTGVPPPPRPNRRVAGSMPLAVLHECKRHTARHIASACYAALWVGSASSIPGWGGTTGTPHYPTIQTWLGDTLGTPPTIQTWDKVPPTIQTWSGGTLGTSNHPDLGWGTPSHPDLRWGTPQPRPGMGYPPCKCGQTENITFPHPSDAGGNYGIAESSNVIVIKTHKREIYKLSCGHSGKVTVVPKAIWLSCYTNKPGRLLLPL